MMSCADEVCQVRGERAARRAVPVVSDALTNDLDQAQNLSVCSESAGHRGELGWGSWSALSKGWRGQRPERRTFGGDRAARPRVGFRLRRPPAVAFGDSPVLTAGTCTKVRLPWSHLAGSLGDGALRGRHIHQRSSATSSKFPRTVPPFRTAGSSKCSRPMVSQIPGTASELALPLRLAQIPSSTHPNSVGGRPESRIV